MNEKMYPICTILYKTDNSAGWYYAIMSGNEDEVQEECEKRKLKYNWYDYKCYVSSEWVIKQDIPFQNIMPESNYIHHLTDLIYDPFNNKFYYSDEIMPYPETRKRTTNNFGFSVKGEGEDDECIWEPEDIDDFECGTDVVIDFGYKGQIVTIAEDLKADINKFIEQLKNCGYANLSVEEYTYTKFLAWEYHGKIRFIVQYYGDSDIETVFDKLIPENIFYKEFEKLTSELQKYITRHNELYDIFKTNEEFLKNIKWEFDTTNYDNPKEYSCLEWNTDKINKFKQFQKTIEEKSEEYTLNFDTKEKSCCYRQNDYYYWSDENKIIRKLFYNYKIKDIVRFINSSDFEYKKGMSLTDIYNQLLDKDYY